MKLTIFSLLFIISVLFINVPQVEAKKKKNKIKYPEFSSHKRPNDIEPLLYCESCRGIIWLMVKTLKGSSKEIDISETIDSLCHVDNYPKNLKFSPPHMADTC